MEWWPDLTFPPINLWSVPKQMISQTQIDELAAQEKQLSYLNANDKQIGGNHYKKYKYEPWDVILDWNLGYLEGSALKYISRWKDKGGVQDIKKAIHFLEKLVETCPTPAMANKPNCASGCSNTQSKCCVERSSASSDAPPKWTPDLAELERLYTIHAGWVKAQDNFEGK